MTVHGGQILRHLFPPGTAAIASLNPFKQQKSVSSGQAGSRRDGNTQAPAGLYFPQSIRLGFEYRQVASFIDFDKITLAAAIDPECAIDTTAADWTDGRYLEGRAGLRRNMD